MAFSAPSSFFAHHPIDPNKHYTLRVRPIHGCSKCERTHVYGDRKDQNWAMSALRCCDQCGVARYCSNVCRLTDRFSIPGNSESNRHSEVCKPPQPPAESRCTVYVGDVDVFCNKSAFRAGVLQAAQEAASKKLEAILDRRRFLAQHRPDWTFEPLYLLFDLYHPGQVWIDEPDQVFNGHVGLVTEASRVIRILRQSSPKYQFFAFGLEPVSAVIDLICINPLLLGVIEEVKKQNVVAAEDKKGKLKSALAEKMNARRKKK